MTDAEIIKALECCADEYIHSCDYCPFEKECNGDNLNLVKYALDLINRQKAEIERLNKEVDRLSQIVLYHDGHIADAQAEAIKEFVEAFKVKFAKERYRDNYVIDDEMLDNLVKEMVGDTE